MKLSYRKLLIVLFVKQRVNKAMNKNIETLYLDFINVTKTTKLVIKPTPSETSLYVKFDKSINKLSKKLWDIKKLRSSSKSYFLKCSPIEIYLIANGNKSIKLNKITKM